MIFQLVVQFIRTRLVRAWAIAQQVAGQIRQAIVDKIMEMYHGVQQWFSTLASNIGSWLSTAAANTLSGAQQIYNNIINKVKEIPGKVGDEFGRIGGIIKDKLVQAAQNAMSGAAGIVSSFLAGLERRSPGKVQRETLAEFASLSGHIETEGLAASHEAYKQATGIVSSWRRGMPSLLNPNMEVTSMDNMRNMQYSTPRRPTVQNSTIRNEDNTRHITIENVTLDCNNLTQAQSRRILYNALQGL
jgi:hypothetical protein